MGNHKQRSVFLYTNESERLVTYISKEKQLPSEQHLSPHLQKAIDDLKTGEKAEVLHLDCLYDEVYGSINADYWGGCLTKEQADYLPKKHLYSEEQVAKIEMHDFGTD